MLPVGVATAELMMLGAEGCSKDPNSPVAAAEAAAPVVKDVCTLLVGDLAGGGTISVCALIDEIPLVVELITSLMAQRPAGLDAGACTTIPSTSLCATRGEIGQAAEMLVKRRQARLARDGGAR